MKRTSVALVILFLAVNFSSAQFIDIPSETKTKLKSNLILGFINPKNFSMTHSFNVSYVNMGNASVSLASYTNTMSYKILDNLMLSADVTMQYSPFASIGGFSSAANRDFQNSLGGINLSRVSLEYKPLKNLFVRFDYVNNSNNYYLNNRYNNPWLSNSDF